MPSYTPQNCHWPGFTAPGTIFQYSYNYYGQGVLCGFHVMFSVGITKISPESRQSSIYARMTRRGASWSVTQAKQGNIHSLSILKSKLDIQFLLFYYILETFIHLKYNAAGMLKGYWIAILFTYLDFSHDEYNITYWKTLYYNCDIINYHNYPQIIMISAWPLHDLSVHERPAVEQYVTIKWEAILKTSTTSLRGINLTQFLTSSTIINTTPQVRINRWFLIHT